MPRYSLARAKDQLSKLVDEALAGEQVIISRHGKPAVELRPAARDPAHLPLSAFDEWRSRSALPHKMGAADVALAERVVRDFATKLSAGDALHLAIAMNEGASVVTFDDRLAEVASMRGVRVARL